MEKNKRIEEIKRELTKLPKGNLTYKTIKGKRQPYLQWTENGKIHTCYIKLSEREQLFVDLERRRSLQEELTLLETYSVKISEILRDNPYLKGNPYIGGQDFEVFRRDNILYVDKTRFIVDWWKADEVVTLITRPRRFGKTLMLSTVEHFFANRYQEGEELFANLQVLKAPGFRELMGSYPVIFLSFGSIKTGVYQDALKSIAYAIREAYLQYARYWGADFDFEKRDTFDDIINKLLQGDFLYLAEAVNLLCGILHDIYGKKVIILLDEYDTPMQEAYVSDQWDELSTFMKGFFNATFKNNPYLERALITGITKVSKESLFSDMNHVCTYTVTREKYAEYFGFTQKEVANILQVNDIDELENIRSWYDGFRFGCISHIYNPWSIMNYVRERKLLPYWVDTGGYGLLCKILERGHYQLFDDLHALLNGEVVTKKINENISFQDLVNHEECFWPLLLAAGAVTPIKTRQMEDLVEADLKITNRETRIMYKKIVDNWFSEPLRDDFCKYLILGDLDYMNAYMNDITFQSIGMFDVGVRPSVSAPERFYHGFVLGLVISLRDQYVIESNRESGFGRYDIMLRPKQDNLPAIIMEFKVRDSKKEKDLDATVRSALSQIEKKQYQQTLASEGISEDRIVKYGFAFEGKQVLIGRE